jgi:hypothetical protein
MARAQDQGQLRDALDRMVGRCSVCLLARRDARHRFFWCTASAAELPPHEYNRLKGAIKFARYTCCYRCAAPQKLCQYWNEQVRECNYRGIIYPLLFVARRNEALAHLIPADVRASEARYLAWLVQPRQDKMTNAIWLFSAAVEVFEL